MHTITNRDALKICIKEYNGDKDGLAEEIIESMRLGEGENSWAGRPFVQRARRRAPKVDEVPAVDPRQLALGADKKSSISNKVLAE